jgi:hypothetical protein
MAVISRLLKRATVAGTMAAAIAISLPVVDAHAMNRTDCAGRTDFFTIWNYNYTGELCFANAGSANVAIYQVDATSPGNNNVQYVIDNGAKVTQLNGWGTFNLAAAEGYTPEITWINLY